MTIVSAFPGTGKSFCFNSHEFLPYVPRVIPKFDETLGHHVPVLKATGEPIKPGWPVIADSDSTMFPKETRNGESWVKQYIDYIAYVQKNHPQSFQFVSTHREVRKALFDHKLPHIVVAPHKSLKDVYIKRYVDRGSPDAFVKLMEDKFEEFADDCVKFMPSDSFGVVVTDPTVFLKNILTSWNHVGNITQLRNMFNGVVKTYHEFYMVCNSFYQGFRASPLLIPNEQLPDGDPTEITYADAHEAMEKELGVIKDFMPGAPDDQVVIKKNSLIEIDYTEDENFEKMLTTSDITVGMIRRAIGEGVHIEDVRNDTSVAQYGCATDRESGWLIRAFSDKFVPIKKFCVYMKKGILNKDGLVASQPTLVIES